VFGICLGHQIPGTCNGRAHHQDEVRSSRAIIPCRISIGRVFTRVRITGRRGRKHPSVERGATHRLCSMDAAGNRAEGQAAFSFQGHRRRARPARLKRCSTLQSPDAAPLQAQLSGRRPLALCTRPKELNIQSILTSGRPHHHRQACEFDYRARRPARPFARRATAHSVNSNPATIMTDPEMRTPSTTSGQLEDGGPHHREGAAGGAAADDGRTDCTHTALGPESARACSTNTRLS